MPIPEDVAWLRSHVGTDELWLPGVTAVGAVREVLEEAARFTR